MSFSGYKSYKDSGLPWLGEIPAHWFMSRSRRLFAQRKERARANERQLTASQKHGVIYQDEYTALEGQHVVRVLTGADILKHVEPNDFVISMRSFQGGIEWCGQSGSISSAYVVLIPSDSVYPKFFSYLFKCKPYIQALQSTSNLVRDGQALRYENFTLIDLPVVPYPEQQSIAAFLDDEVAKIDNLMTEQDRLIGLLKEKRHSVISHVVTKGLDSRVPMKESGVEWLGRVPQHWEVKAIRNVANVVRGASPRPAGDPLYFGGSAVPWVTVAEITKDELIYLTKTETFLTEDGAKQSNFFKKGTLIYSNSGATLGVPKLLGIDACANDGVIAFESLSPAVHPHFLYHFLASITDAIREKIKQGSGQPNLNTDIVKGLRFGLPSFDEQKLIVAHIAELTDRFRSLISEARLGTSLLQERRAALVSAAVTGKIDVRGLIGVQMEEVAAK